MTESISVATAREADARTINEIGIPSLVLMERAALGSTARLLNGDFDLTKVSSLPGLATTVVTDWSLPGYFTFAALT